MIALKIADKLSRLILASGSQDIDKFLAGKSVTSILHDPEFLDTFRRKSMRLFVDMDGVLTDWKKQYLDFGGQDFVDHNDIDWKVTQSLPFWSTMKWLPGGHELWDSLKHLNPTVLSSPGISRYSKEGKAFWVSENLGESTPYILDTQKQRYADGRSILVDDMEKFLGPWEAKGGIGILYKDPSSAARELYRKVMGLS